MIKPMNLNSFHIKNKLFTISIFDVLGNLNSELVDHSSQLDETLT